MSFLRPSGDEIDDRRNNNLRRLLHEPMPRPMDDLNGIDFSKKLSITNSYFTGCCFLCLPIIPICNHISTFRLRERLRLNLNIMQLHSLYLNMNLNL
jgi:hypothetical protein